MKKFVCLLFGVLLSRPLLAEQFPATVLQLKYAPWGIILVGQKLNNLMMVFMKKQLAGISLVLGFLLISLAAVVRAESTEKTPLTDVAIHPLDGKEFKLSRFQGNKYVYLKFWATWCEECIQQMPHLQQVYLKYGKDVEIIAINLGVDDDEKSVSDVKQKFNLTMPIAIDKSGELARATNLLATPLHVLLDKNGNVIYKKYVETDGIDERLASIVAGKSVTADIVSSELAAQVNSPTEKNYSEKPTALFFLATWCDWYFESSRPKASKNCVASQQTVNQLSQEFPQVNWFGVATRLWTEQKDVVDYQKKFSVKFPINIDLTNEIVFSRKVKNYPTLILLKDGQEFYRSSSVDYIETKKAISDMLGE